MVRKGAALGPLNPRRSARLKNGVIDSSILQTMDVIPSRSRKRKSPDTEDLENVPQANRSRAGATPLRAVKIEAVTAEELAEQDQSLHTRETELRKRRQSLDARERELNEREESHKRREAQSILNLLEETYQCALCFEILACPYTLLSADCGHTFCAQCALKWFFACIHTCCGTWHESVTCPLCRSPLILTPEEVPRHKETFPFAPNRIVAESITAMFTRFDATFPRPKKSQRRTTKKARLLVCKAGNTTADVKIERPLDQIGEANVTAWATGGEQRSDWTTRYALGRKEMEYLHDNWTELDTHDFLDVRQRLGL